MEATPTVTAKTTVEQPSAATAITENGYYVIGRDITTGVWHTDGPRPHKRRFYDNGTMVELPDISAPCRWQIGWPANDQGGDEIVAVTKGQTTAASDVKVDQQGMTFMTWDCQPWRLSS